MSFLALADFSRSLEWRGIGDVEDGNGQIVTSF